MAFTVDTDRIQAASADITRNAAELEQSVAALAGRLGALQGAWTGSAATEFQEVMTRWRGLQKQVRDDLDAIGQLLGKAGTTYRTTEDSVRGLFSR